MKYWSYCDCQIQILVQKYLIGKGVVSLVAFCSTLVPRPHLLDKRNGAGTLCPKSWALLTQLVKSNHVIIDIFMVVGVVWS